MSKRLISLFLCLVMLLGIGLTSCGQKTDEEAKDANNAAASEGTRRLVMYLMSEKPVDDATAQQIEDAVNAITQDRFKTKMELFFYTEKEYYAKLDAAFAKREKAEKDKTLVVDKQSDVEETVIVDGKVEIKYPNIAEEYQVDIFYLGGKDMYDKYTKPTYTINNKKQAILIGLDTELNGKSKDIMKNIPGQYMNNLVNLNRGTYAIPNSSAIGEYTYLLLNKEALKKAETPFKAEKFNSLTSDAVKAFLADVSKPTIGLTDKYYPLYTNINSTEELISNLHYWGVDSKGNLSDDFSVLGGYYQNTDDYLDKNKYPAVGNLFENEQFVKDITTLKEYEFNNYYGEDSEDKKFAVGYIKGGAELVEKYGDEYEMIPVAYPRLTEEQLYSDMFGVCVYSSDARRSMQILTALTTEAELRNILLYGIEGEHYQLNDSGVKNKYDEPIMVVEKFEEKSDKYVMDINKTGNAFNAYPTADELPNIKEYGSIQNQEAKVDLTLGFALNFEVKSTKHSVDVASLKKVRALSDAILAEYKACANMEELETFIANAKTSVSESADVAAHLGCQSGKSHSTSKCHSLTCVLNEWLKSKKVI